MNTLKDKQPESEHDKKEHRRHMRRHKTVRILAWVSGGVAAFVVAVLLGVTMWLTPDRLTDLVNREASEYLDADVKASGVRFTLWSSFPHFCLETDSLRVISRTLDSISPAQRDSLPADASRLLTTGRIHGSINLLQLLRGVISLRDVEVSYLDLNLVALNDSLTNYSILPPESRGSFKMPRFTANSVNLPKMRPIRYYSAHTATYMSVPVDSARITRTDTDRYRLTFAGVVSLRSDGLVVLRDFPVRLGGDVSTAFHPFRVRLSDFDVALANTRGKINLDLDFGDNAAINRFSYDLGNLNPLSLLTYLPGAEMPFLKELKADIDLNLSARLTSPYLFSATTLPSLAVDFHSADGKAEYDFGGDEKISVNNILLDGSFNFDGANPAASSIRVKRLSLDGEGASFDVSADITDLTATPYIDAYLTVSTQLTKIPRYFPFLRGYGLKGLFDLSSHISFALGGEQNLAVTSPQASGTLRLSRAALTQDGVKCRVDSLTIAFDAEADSLGETGIGKAILHARLQGQNADVALPGYKIELPKLAADLSLTDEASGKLPYADFSLLLPSATLRSPSADMRIDGLTAGMSAHDRAGRRHKSDVTPASSDEAALRRLPHSPEYLTVNLSDRLRALYSEIGVRVALKARSGEISTPSFPAANTFSNLDLTLTNDSLRLGCLKFRSLKSRAKLSGWMAGLDNLITGGQPTPLHAYIILEGDTISINQLANTFAHGSKSGRSSQKTSQTSASPAPTASDSVALLIPRNLLLDMDAKIKETIYTDLHLYDLKAALDTHSGNLRLNDLHISSDFGRATLDLGYDTSDILAIGLQADAALENIDLVRFFQRFHSLLLMMPQMKNLSGYISAEASMGLQVYPDMNADVASLTAQIGLQGRDLKVHQDAFIRRITRMMMIRTDADLHIANMNVRASVHDNLLELYPFTFSFDRYRLTMQGINNFDGRLYYHVGVLQSPLHFPFGINIKGMFSHPELRFGRATYKEEEGAKVARHVMETESFNLVSEAKYFLREFLRKAAESDETPEASYKIRKL